MVDYTVGISASSTMMIRDTGGVVEFWFITGSQTWNNDQQWAFAANGGTSGILKFRLLRGGNWQKFGAVYVGYDQDVTFTIYGSGIGFPTYSFTHHIYRQTVPQPPTILSVEPNSTTEFHVVFQGNNDGGSPVLEWQIGYGSSSNGPQFTVGSSGTSDVGGFTAGQRVYFWARARNALGWSGWSVRGESTTWRVPDAPSIVYTSQIKQTSVRTQFYGGFNGGLDFTDHQLGYGTDPDDPTDFLNNLSGIHTLTDLDPGAIYYLWARSENAVGWGPWSARSQVILIAGIRVLVGFEWKRAVPYVNVGGVWKVAKPWVRNAGVWKQTSI
jgi:hypothetical protein